MCCAACSCGTWRLKFVRCVRKAFCVHTNPFCPATASVCFYDQVNNEQAWRQLNRNVLMKTRKPTPVVRFAALRITQELFKTLGEDFMQMLPESIPSNKMLARGTLLPQFRISASPSSGFKFRI